jgi:hypothetical protein
VAKAGEAAGPAAHRAAEATAELGEKVAAKGRDIAADLRRSSHAAGDPTDGSAPAEAAAAPAPAPAEAQPVADGGEPPASDPPAGG